MADPVDQLETEPAAVTKRGRGSRCSDSTEHIQHGLHELCNMEALVCGMSHCGVAYQRDTCKRPWTKQESNVRRTTMKISNSNILGGSPACRFS